MKFKDLTNVRVNKLVAISISHRYKNNIYWKCKCDCGKETVITSGNFKNSKSCGCYKKKNGSESFAWKGRGDLSAALICKIKACAKKRNIKYSLNIDYLWELFQKQKGKCVLTGMDLILPKTHQEISHGQGTASLDRINSNLGYIKNNVQWIHKDVNMMKQQFSQEYFIKICRLITERQK